MPRSGSLAGGTLATLAVTSGSSAPGSTSTACGAPLGRMGSGGKTDRGCMAGNMLGTTETIVTFSDGPGLRR